MKRTKKLASVLLALVLVLALATTAFADGDTAGDTEEAQHTYEIYQIFTGVFSDGVLSDVKWGQNGTGAEGSAVPDDVLEELEAIPASTSDTEKLDIILKYAKLEAAEDEEAVEPYTSGNGTKYENLDNGYYLVKNTDGIYDGKENAFYTLYVVQVVNGTLEFEPKGDVPTLDKQITDDDNNIDNDIAEGGKSDNVSIGSTVTYTLTGTIPASAANYDYYYYIINDTLSEGLTFNEDSVAVTIGDRAATADTDYVLYTGEAAEGYTFQVALLDAKAHAGEAVVVTYTATLNEKAVIGEANGNPNTANLTYSNNPNEEYAGTDTNGDGKPDEGQNVPLGKTPVSTTRTYTTGIKLLKVDEDGMPLTGAEFQITGENVVIVLVSDEIFNVDNENGTYWKLATGAYTTEAPQLKDEYVEKEAGDRDGGYVKDGDTYREATSDELADTSVTLYKQIKANADLYADANIKYSKTVTFHQEGTDQTETDVKAYVGGDGVLVFEGLGEGTYTIKETTTPAGYNTINDITVKIGWTAPVDDGTDCAWKATATVNGEENELVLNSDGVFELTVENIPGTLLPTTGGMGTTVFYVVGGVLVLAAIVLLITKKRMSARG